MSAPMSDINPEEIHDLNYWHPLNNGKFCMCLHRDLKMDILWIEPAYFDDFKFWIIKGLLKGKQLPFVTHWRYMTLTEFSELKDLK